MLLDHFGLKEETDAVVKSVNLSLKNGIVTPDLKAKSQYGTDDVGHFIASHISDADDYRGLNRENIGLGKSTII
jgi:3-isopropylmalate dehydrogenase